MKIVVIGSDGIGKIVSPEGVEYTAWSGTAQASGVGLACALSPDDAIYLIPRIGFDIVDEYATFLAQKYEGRLDSSHALTDPRGNNAGHNVTVGEMWEIQLTYRPDPIRLEELPHDVLAEADAIVFNAGCAEMYEGSLIGEVKERFPHLFIYVDVHLNVCYLDHDFVMYYGPWPTWRTDLSAADAVQLNEHEAALMLDTGAPVGISAAYPPAEAIVEILSCGAKRVALTLADRGCIVCDESRHLSFLPAVPIDEVVDSCGAGDAFGGAFLAGLLTGKSTVEAALMGCVTGAATCQCLGYLTPSDLTRDDINATVSRLREEGRCWSHVTPETSP